MGCFMTACNSGISQEQYDQAVAEVSQYSSELEEEKAANAELKKQVESIRESYESVSKEFASYEESMEAYKTKMAPYEELAAEEEEHTKQIQEISAAYHEALDLTLDDLIGEKFHGIELLPEDIEDASAIYNKTNAINQGAMYRSVAKKLSGFDMFGYGNWGNSDICEVVFGIPKPNTREELEPLMKSATTIIIDDDNPGKAILRRLSKSPFFEGTINETTLYESDFSITDLLGLKEELQISSEMLGFIFAQLNEYALEFSFDGNTCKTIH